MARVAFIADSHFDETPGGRFGECTRLHDWITEDLATRKIDLVVHGGDLFERRSTPRERAAAADWLRDVAELAPVVLVRGNHDAIGDLSIFGRLRTRHPIVVEEAAGVHQLAGVNVACLAWPRKAELLARMEGAGKQAGEQAAADALRNVIRGLGAQLDQREGPELFLAHAMVRASRVSTGQPLVGCDLEVGLEDLALARADGYLLGHIHLGQHWTVDVDGFKAPVIYPGSPRRTAFGESEPKGYVVLELGENGVESWTRVPTPATPMLLVEGELVDAECPESGEAMRALQVSEAPRGGELQGAEIRLRYTVDAEEREHAKHEAEAWKKSWLGQGAAAVKLEALVRSTTRARVPEIAEASTLEDKLAALWRARGEEPEPERRQLLVAKAHQLEQEVRDAS